MPSITPNLWFDTESEKAAEFYCSIFPNSKINAVTHYGEAGPREAGMVLTVEFELDGKPFTAINGGPEFTFDEAVSFAIECDDQAEVDRYWDALIANGGQPSVCGWLKDRFGLSWQVVPKRMSELFAGDDRAGAERAMQAMLQMTKLDIDALEQAYAGEPVGSGAR
jgi:predicted 3-demethylubiquinone-9 3-methyltransferase (glyoxalase superfamily)